MYVPEAVFSINKYLLFSVTRAEIVTHATLVAPENSVSKMKNDLIQRGASFVKDYVSS